MFLQSLSPTVMGETTQTVSCYFKQVLTIDMMANQWYQTELGTYPKIGLKNENSVELN